MKSSVFGMWSLSWSGLKTHETGSWPWSTSPISESTEPFLFEWFHVKTPWEARRADQRDDDMKTTCRVEWSALIARQAILHVVWGSNRTGPESISGDGRAKIADPRPGLDWIRSQPVISRSNWDLIPYPGRGYARFGHIPLPGCGGYQTGQIASLNRLEFGCDMPKSCWFGQITPDWGRFYPEFSLVFSLNGGPRMRGAQTGHLTLFPNRSHIRSFIGSSIRSGDLKPVLNLEPFFRVETSIKGRGMGCGTGRRDRSPIHPPPVWDGIRIYAEIEHSNVIYMRAKDFGPKSSKIPLRSKSSLYIPSCDI